MLRLPELLVALSHVVYWLGYGALTAMARVEFPAWEFQIYKCAIPFTLNFLSFSISEKILNFQFKFSQFLIFSIFSVPGS